MRRSHFFTRAWGQSVTVDNVPGAGGVPTVAESGYPGFEADQWYGVVAPAGTPDAIIRRLNAQINLALKSDERRNRLTAEGAVATPGTPEAFGQLIVAEIARWKPVISSGRVKAD